MQSLKELIKFVEKIDKKLDDFYPKEKDSRIMAKALKVSEEYGELINEILAQ